MLHVHVSSFIVDVPLDVLGAALERAEPLGLRRMEQLADQVLGLRRDLLGILDVTRYDIRVEVHRVSPLKGRVAHEELEEQDAHRPPVHSLVVPLVENDLWCHVLRRATDGPRAVLDALGEAKVDHLE
eukprot:scaffold91543_cov33-Phaeocystis_antarctica.AAC.1